MHTRDAADVTTFTYDVSYGALKTVTTPSGTTTFSNFDAFGRPGQVTDPNGNATTLVYDVRGRLRQTTDVSTSAVTGYDYDPAGKLAKITLPLGNTLSFTRATNGEVETITDSLGNKITYGYDEMNNRNLVEVRDPGGVLRRSLQMSFNNPSNSNWSGLLWHLQNPDASFTELDYDGNTNLTKLTDPDGNLSQFAYDPLDHLSSITQTVAGSSVATASRECCGCHRSSMSARTSRPCARASRLNHSRTSASPMSAMVWSAGGGDGTTKHPVSSSWYCSASPRLADTTVTRSG